MAVQARCMRCKKSVDVKDLKEVVMKNGRPAISGVCSICGTKVFKIVKAGAKPEAVAPTAAAVPSPLNTESQGPIAEALAGPDVTPAVEPAPETEQPK